MAISRNARGRRAAGNAIRDAAAGVARADLTYAQPVGRSEEGMPVGNGRMGSLVWTEPDALKFQLNRVDVFAVGCDTCAFPGAGADYASGCGSVDIRMGEYGPEVFAGRSFRQHLAVKDGRVTVRGRRVAARVTAWQQGDVMAVEIDDRRPRPAPISIDLRMLRYATQWMDAQNWHLTCTHAAVALTGPHSATSRRDIRDGRILLMQYFREGAFYHASAVAIGIQGRPGRASYPNETTVRLTAAPGRGKFTVLMATAASADPKEDVAAKALAALQAAEDRALPGILADNRAWWAEFWSRGGVQLHSRDGEADLVEQSYTYFLYIMASSSRGAYMPRFGGMIWFTNGDMRQWGSQFWWNNQGCYYNGLTPANRPELLEPVFNTYSGHFDSYARAARQQWGSQGVWFPETTWFDGLEDLPEALAAEMRDLYLMRKPWDQRSDAFRQLSRHKQTFNSRWNWITYGEWRHGERLQQDKGMGPFGHVTHVFSSTAKIAYLYWLRYAYHLDADWLRRVGYPVIKGVVEFYRNFPNLRKGPDGKLHITTVNNLESDWNSRDTPEEVVAMRALTPIAMRASEILGVDADLRTAWGEFYRDLPPLPDGPLPAEYYELLTVADPKAPAFRKLQREFARKNKVSPDTRLHVLSRDAVAAANLGLAEHVRRMIPGQIRTHPEEGCDTWGAAGENFGLLRNRLGLREGPGCLECQRLGNAANALHAALLQSAPPTPDGEPVIRVFPAWPTDWDARFTLAARGGFRVTAAMKKGRIEYVQILSQAGGDCRLANPWPGSAAIVRRYNAEDEILRGKIIAFGSRKMESFLIRPEGILF